MTKNTSATAYTIFFDFKTYGDDSIEDYVKIMNFIPFPGMNIYFSDDEIKLPNDVENRGWFHVADVDYLSKDDVFVICVREMGDFLSE